MAREFRPGEIVPQSGVYTQSHQLRARPCGQAIIGETEFNQTAFRFTSFAAACRGEACARGTLPAWLDHSMRIATYNVNGINGRLANLLGWLKEAAPDIVCLQELKAPDDKFPAAAIRAAGYGAVWHGQKSWNGVAILARGAEPVETRRGLPGDPDDTHSRYIEAAIGGMIVGCLYLPNGNPAPGPKFDYKLRWFDRLTELCQEPAWRAARRSCSPATTT